MLGQTSTKRKPGLKNASKVGSFIAQYTELRGDIEFSGGLYVDGTIKGDVIATEDGSAILNIAEHGIVQGDVRVPNVVINGTVNGDVHAMEHIELATQARVTGNLYYSLIAMALGAEVNGSLIHAAESPPEKPIHTEDSTEHT